jgi:inorganic pyrophosphatase
MLYEVSRSLVTTRNLGRFRLTEARSGSDQFPGKIWRRRLMVRADERRHVSQPSLRLTACDNHNSTNGSESADSRHCHLTDCQSENWRPSYAYSTADCRFEAEFQPCGLLCQIGTALAVDGTRPDRPSRLLLESNMQLSKISAGDNVPENLNVVIEIPIGGEPVKYELDKDSGALVVDRILSTSMRYPGNYGFIPKTLGDDGDPLDVLIVCDTPFIPGSVISCRTIGVLRMTDEAGGDEKIIAVPSRRVSRMFDRVNSLDDVAELRLRQIAHFFENYKGLDAGKWVKLSGWGSREEANAIIVAGLRAATKSDTKSMPPGDLPTPEQHAPADAKAGVLDIQALLMRAAEGGAFEADSLLPSEYCSGNDGRIFDHQPDKRQVA